MRTQLFSATAEPQALAGHLSPVGLGASLAGTQPGAAPLTPLQPGAAPTPWGNRARQRAGRGGRKRGPVKSTEADTSYLQRRRKTFPTSALLLPFLRREATLVASGAAHQPQPGPEPTHTLGKPRQRFHCNVPAGWW